MTLEMKRTVKTAYGFFRRGQKVKFPDDKKAKTYAKELIDGGFAVESKQSKAK